jgi:hypothetical protein
MDVGPIDPLHDAGAVEGFQALPIEHLPGRRNRATYLNGWCKSGG